MNILSFGIDTHLFKEGSPTRARIAGYGALVDSLHIIVLSTKKVPEIITRTIPIPIAKNVFVYSTQSSNKISAIFHAYLIAKSIIRDQHFAKENSLVTTQDPFEIGLLGMWVARRAQIGFHAQVHIDFFSPLFKAESLRNRFQTWIAPHVLTRANAIRVVSKKIETYLIESLHINKEKITFVPVFVNPVEVVRRIGSLDLHTLYPQFDHIILVAARFVKQKNIPLAISAFAMCLSKYPNAGLVIAGSGNEEHVIRACIRKHGLEKNVILGSWTTDFISCMNTCDVFLLSSDYEGWGMTLIEAAALGKPIVMTDVGCAQESIVDHVNGIIVPPRDAEKMSVACMELFGNPQLALSLGDAAKKMAGEYMSKEENDSRIKNSWKRAILL
jgi:glycosyltransferase involved in cell wall biosynthesis